METKFTCGSCQKMGCVTSDVNNMPSNCPSMVSNLIEAATEKYRSDVDMLMAYNSARIKIDTNIPMTRTEETIDFIRRCGYKNIGLAFCRAVKKDAEILTKKLKEEGFIVNSVMCRTGGISESILEKEGETFIYDKKQGRQGYDTMCNPIAQAEILENAGTEFNIILGLCVGHDTLFIRHSKTPMTVLGVKDRLLGSTPIVL